MEKAKTPKMKSKMASRTGIILICLMLAGTAVGYAIVRYTVTLPGSVDIVVGSNDYSVSIWEDWEATIPKSTLTFTGQGLEGDPSSLPVVTSDEFYVTDSTNFKWAIVTLVGVPTGENVVLKVTVDGANWLNLNSGSYVVMNPTTQKQFGIKVTVTSYTSTSFDFDIRIDAEDTQP